MPEDLNAVKLVKEDEGLIEGYGIPFGGPQHGRDLDGEAFTSDTKFNLDAYPDRRPLFYQHGMDESLGFDHVGYATKAMRQDKGIWFEAQIDKAKEYGSLLLELARSGMLGFSSGAFPRSIKKTADGVFQVWIPNELSLTPIPANPFSVVSVKSGQPIIDIKAQAAIFTKLGRLPDADEAAELSQPYVKAEDSDLERRIKLLERQNERRELNLQVKRLRLDHERLLHEVS